MVKKSNKTDHVLSLLSNGGKDKAQEKNTEAAKPPVVPDRDKDREEKESSPVSIVHASTEKKGLAETIKKSLEDELDKMLPDTAPKDEEKGAEAAKLDQILKSELTQEGGTETSLEIDIEPEPILEGTEAPCELVIEETEPERGSATEPEGENATEEEEFVFLNVMEALVKEKVLGYMKQFGNCTCPRCIADTTALALTQLPPKYVVINKETVSPFMNFYTKKFAGQITVEITKACIRVGEAPHHNRD